MTNKNEELRYKIYENQKDFIEKLIKCLHDDPDASESDINYTDNLIEYLWEILDKEDSILHGIICSLERYLDK